VRVAALSALQSPQSGTLAVYVPALLKVLLTFGGGYKMDDSCFYYGDKGMPELFMMELAFEVLQRVNPSDLVAHVQPVLEALRAGQPVRPWLCLNAWYGSPTLQYSLIQCLN
jgi:hypothetical protein